MNWEPPRNGRSEDSTANGGDEIIETRNPVDFGDIPFGDIGVFKELVAKGIDAVVICYTFYTYLVVVVLKYSW